jgi:uncharacterized protein YndB with AHSA1/START domain
MTMDHLFMKFAAAIICFGASIQTTAQAENVDVATVSHDLTITRVFDASVEAIWNAWSDADQVKQWWGPRGFTAPVAEMDFREGGSSFVCMHNPAFGTLCNIWRYTRIVPMKRIEFTQKWADEAGNIVDSEKAGVGPGLPDKVPHQISFEDQGNGKVKLTISEFGYPSLEIVERSRAGMEQCLDRMAEIFRAD